MDDPNVPSLLAAPLPGYRVMSTMKCITNRRSLLLPENYYFYQGKYAMSWCPATFYRYIRPIALIQRLDNGR